MPRPSEQSALRTITVAGVTAISLSFGWITASAASPDDEIARLNQVRERLFEELVKTRKDAASVGAELETAINARDRAEAELTRLKLETTAAKPADQPSAIQANIQPQKQAPAVTSAPLSRRTAASATQPDVKKKVRPPEQGVTASTPKAIGSVSQRHIKWATVPGNRVSRQADPESQSGSNRRGLTREMGGYGNADGSLSSNGPGIW
jgi:hypothetical protein